MAIIKTLLLQVFFLLALIGAVQAANKAFKAAIGVKATFTKTCGSPLTLECTDSQADGDVAITHVQFFKGNKNVTGWLDINVKKEYVVAVATLDVTHKGDYICKGALSGTGTGIGDASDPAIDVGCDTCGSESENCIHDRFICKGSPTRTCQCKYGGSYTNASPTDCYECKDTEVELCPLGNKHCNADGACVACLADDDNTGCVADSATPRCEASGTPVCRGCDEALENTGCKADSGIPRCNKTDGTDPGKCKPCNAAFCKKEKCDEDPNSSDVGKCLAKITTSATDPSKKSESTAGSGTEQTSKASVTSSAGTVTSTACLVIASVVVALMN